MENTSDLLIHVKHILGRVHWMQWTRTAPPQTSKFHPYFLHQLCIQYKWPLNVTQTCLANGLFVELFTASITTLFVGEESKRLFDEAQVMLARIVEEDLLKARGVVALFPANSVGDDIQVFSEDRSSILGTLHGLRQQVTKLGVESAIYCLAYTLCVFYVFLGWERRCWGTIPMHVRLYSSEIKWNWRLCGHVCCFHRIWNWGSMPKVSTCYLLWNNSLLTLFPQLVHAVVYLIKANSYCVCNTTQCIHNATQRINANHSYLCELATQPNTTYLRYATQWVEVSSTFPMVYKQMSNQIELFG